MDPGTIMNSTLLELASRVEQATGPDRRLDAEISLALGIGPRGGALPPNTRWYLDKWPNGDAPNNRHRLVSVGGPDGSFGWAAIKFTASLDAAMTLAGDDVFAILLDALASMARFFVNFRDKGDSSPIKNALPRFVTAASLRALAEGRSDDD